MSRQDPQQCTISTFITTPCPLLSHKGKSGLLQCFRSTIIHIGTRTTSNKKYILVDTQSRRNANAHNTPHALNSCTSVRAWSLLLPRFQRGCVMVQVLSSEHTHRDRHRHRHTHTHSYDYTQIKTDVPSTAVFVGKTSKRNTRCCSK